MNAISYHESRMNPSSQQLGGGPGRGLFQFETGSNAGGITAARRTKAYLEDKGEQIPAWLDNAMKKDSLDASTLSPEQQQMLFLGNMRMHPRANFSDVWEGNTTVRDFWADYHWAGDKRDRPKRLKSFDESYNSLSTKAPMLTDPVVEPIGHEQFAEGGPTDPPTKKYSKQQEFIENWMTNPITMDKLISKRQQYSDNPEIDLSKDAYWDVARALNKLDKVGINELPARPEGVSKATLGQYNPNTHQLNIYREDFTNHPSVKDIYDPFYNSTAIHELTHSTGLDRELSRYIQRDVGFIKLKDDDLPGERKYKQYLNHEPELFPRTMQLRYELGLEPGQEVNTEMLDNPKIKSNDLYQYYGLEGIRDILNKSVYNSKSSNTNVAAYGGKMGKTSKLVDRKLNSFGTGGLHGTNPHGGIPLGTGANGKLNTVEQGEKSYPLGGGHFIFSNRLYLK